MKFVKPDAGIHVNPAKIRPNSTIEVSYDGLLAQSGAQEVYVHCGTAYLKDWTDIQDIKMTKNLNGTFSAAVPISEGNTLNLCFHDNAYNWDNNSGNNYSYHIND